MAAMNKLIPANWVHNRTQWELAEPTFCVPRGQDPALLSAVVAQHTVARQVIDHLRNGDANQFSPDVSLALAGCRPLTFATYCELITLFGPDAVPTPTALAEATESGIRSAEQRPEPQSGAPVSDATDASPDEVPHPDAEVAISGLLMQLGPVIDDWAGESVANGLDIDIEVFVGRGRANLVVAGGMFSGQIWLPKDWDVRIAEEVYTPDGTFVLDQVEINEYPLPPWTADLRVYPVSHPRPPWAAETRDGPLSHFEERTPDNPAYLPFVDWRAARREHKEGGVYYAVVR